MTDVNPDLIPTPQQNLDAEELVLGAMMLATSAIDAVLDEGVTAADFYRASHGKIFECAVRMYSDGDPVDAVTVADKLAEAGDLEDIGGKERLHEIATLVPATSNARHYAKIIREMALLRGLAKAGYEIHQMGLERGTSARALVERAEGKIFDLSSRRSSYDFVMIRETVAESYRRIQDVYENGRGALTGLPSGFSRVDEYTSGFQRGNLVVIAARPSMGKTALGLCIAANVAVRGGQPVAVFTLEMSRAEVTDRLMSSESLVESQKIRNGDLTGDEWGRLTASASRLEPCPILIDDTAGLTAMELRSKARKMKLLHPNLSLVVVDYLQLMTSGGRAENRVQDVSQTSRMMKVLARELDVPVIAISQLSRQVEQRHDRRPILSDLRDSGSIEQDADIVAFIYRDEYYNPEDTDQYGIAEVNIAKHRNGPTGTVKLAFVKRFVRFSELGPDDRVL